MDVLDAPLVARQLIRAIRAHRSQRAFSRRLGYRTNVVSDWEAGRRFPTGGEAWRAATRAGIDVAAALSAFHPGAATAAVSLDDEGVAPWLRALQGSTPQTELAARVGASRYAVGRWLQGTTRPKLPDFLRLVAALTGRVDDLCAAIVPIAQVPALVDLHERRLAGHRLAYEEPWTEAVLRLIETGSVETANEMARRLGIAEETAARALDRLVRAGIVQRGDGLTVVAPLTVDTRSEPEATRALRRHWAQVAADRLGAAHEGDLNSYNVVSVSRADLDRIRAMHRAYYRELRAIVASSEPVETAALVLVQLIEWTTD